MIFANFIFENIANFKNANLVKDFFIKTLYAALKSKQLQGQCVQTSKDSFSLEVQGTQEEILTFSKNLEHSIPLSLQWAFKELVLIESFSTQGIIPCHVAKGNFLTPLELQNLTCKNSKDFCNLWADFVYYTQEKITFLHKGEKLEIKDSKTLQQVLQKSAQTLKNGERIFLKTIFGKYEVAPLDEKRPIQLPSDFTFMPFSLENTKLIFKVEEWDLQALATLEKPKITLSPKSIFAEFFSSAFVNVILPFEPYLVLLGKFLEEYQGLYLLPLQEKLENGICEFVESSTSPLHISVAKNGLTLAYNFSPSAPNANLHALKSTITNNALVRTNAVYLGREDTRFLVYFDTRFKEALEFRFEANLGVIIATLETLNKTTQSLLRNFTKENEALITHLKSLPKDSMFSKNLLDLLGLAGILLDLGDTKDLKESCAKVLLNAANFMGQKGPRIDFRLERDSEGKISLNTLQTLRSIMSFKLAGVEIPLLCFGILDSLAEFFANLSRDMNENYQTQGIVICGEIFLNKQFLNQFLHYLPNTSEVFACEVMEFKGC
ncbi:protein hydE [Helicobacter turcicus]|uniref:Protein hydE n=1 Tax=Helicobacter turcicus TaxID=2867412 RepID=A0ABS7JNW5_9HELI|nr:protein hydE [Helicobacter turcicus]MBX7491055.1 protein hydE [Helicobacter turcicus]MBX7546316.1 protein hydE [Helicobacter turcicus]